MNKKSILYGTLSAAAAVSLAACTTAGPGQITGTGLGAAGGAAAGAIIGNNVRGVSATEGAIAGALIGGLAGNVVGRQQDEINELRRNQSYQQGGYPVGRFSGTRGYVYSPYPPYNMIDVRGIPSGAVVLDPSTNQRFINP